MARNIVFLIHGVGQHTTDWTDIVGGPANALRAAAKNYSYFNTHPLDEAVEFVPIRYDDIFDRILTGWAESARKLREIGGAFSPMLDSGIAFMAKADSGTPVIAVGGDVPLYKGFRLFRHRVLMRVIAEMASTIAARTQTGQGTPPSFHVLAHSLGTTVAHDAIHSLGTEEWPEEPLASERDPEGVRKEKGTFDAAKVTGAFRNGTFRFGSLFQVSNTSGLLHTTAVSPLESIVRPGQYLQTFFNVDHAYDPISKVRPFAVPATWGAMARTLAVRHLYEPNIHGFAHYLLHPQVHVSIFKQLCPDFQLTSAEKATAGQFADISPALVSKGADRLSKELSVLIEKAKASLQDEAQEVKRWVELYREYLQLAQSFGLDE